MSPTPSKYWAAYKEVTAVPYKPKGPSGWPFPIGAHVPIHIMFFLQPKYSDCPHIDYLKTSFLSGFQTNKKAIQGTVSEGLFGQDSGTPWVQLITGARCHNHHNWRPLSQAVLSLAQHRTRNVATFKFSKCLHSNQTIFFLSDLLDILSMMFFMSVILVEKTSL